MTPATLRKLEWAGTDAGGHDVCPRCRWNAYPNRKHAPDCELDAAIREAKEAEKRAALQQRINEHLEVCIYCDMRLTADCVVGADLLAKAAARKLWRQEPPTHD